MCHDDDEAPRHDFDRHQPTCALADIRSISKWMLVYGNGFMARDKWKRAHWMYLETEKRFVNQPYADWIESASYIYTMMKWVLDCLTVERDNYRCWLFDLINKDCLGIRKKNIQIDISHAKAIEWGLAQQVNRCGFLNLTLLQYLKILF